MLYLILSQFILKSQKRGATQIKKAKNTLRQTPPYEAEIIAQNLVVPWALDISDDGKIYFTERGGRVRVIENGVLRPEPLITLEAPFASYGEGGLMGIVLDPNHATNGYIYIMYSYLEAGQLYNRVVRLVERGNTATIDRVLIDRIPGEGIHNGGRLKIGPDNRLYITAGDGRGGMTAQDPTTLAGKILRIDLDGRIPIDNPFLDSPVYTYGHRNPQGITFGPNGIIYASEHGQRAYDEINILVPGGNYGWPLVQGYAESAEIDTIRPFLSSELETWAPSGMAYISEGPWQGYLLVANLIGQQILALRLDESGLQIEAVERWFEDEYGRIRDVVQGPDGSIYILTNNTDGRGNPRPNDDKLIRIIPL